MALAPTVTAASPGTSATAPAPSQATTDAAAITADFETFLKLLTTQLSNQDPLKPLESTQFVAQLASFSAVEQQTRTNALLEEIAQATGLSGGIADHSELIGQEAASRIVEFDGAAPVALTVKPVAGADLALLNVRNDFDQIVATQQVSAQSRDVVWDGEQSSGQTAPPGRYSFDVSYSAQGTELETVRAQGFAAISEIRISDGTPVALLQSGEQIAIDEISALRAPR